MNDGHQHGFGGSSSARSPGGKIPAHPLDWPTKVGAVGDVLGELSLRLKARRRSRIRKAAGAAAALVVAGIGWHSILQKSVPAGLVGAPAPVITSPRKQTLPDGSVVEFRNGAAISVGFTDSLRHVVLERGEAHFAVTKDETRPFVVRAGAIEFRAVGTAFGVHLADSKVEMIVTEGRVAVSSGGREQTVGDRREPEIPSSDFRRATSGILTLVDAGNRVVVDVAAPQIPPPAISVLTSSQMSQRFAWRVPKLEFSGTPLARVVEIINASSGVYRKPLLIIGDRSLASVRISGILRADNVATLIGVLEADHGIRAEKRGEVEIVLHAR